jgi:cytochrome c553
MYPNLAGQHASYIRKSLQDYRDGQRVNPLMSGFATNLSDQDIEDLAAWFASQPGLRDLSSD